MFSCSSFLDGHRNMVAVTNKTGLNTQSAHSTSYADERKQKVVDFLRSLKTSDKQEVNQSRACNKSYKHKRKLHLPSVPLSSSQPHSLPQTPSHKPYNTSSVLLTYAHSIPCVHSIPNLASNVRSHTKQITMPPVLSKPIPNALPPNPAGLIVATSPAEPWGGGYEP